MYDGFSILTIPFSTCRFDKGDVAFIILAGALVFFMVPGVGEWVSILITRCGSWSFIGPSRLPVLRTLSSQERPRSDLGCSCKQCGGHLPVVLLGIQSGIFIHCNKRLHWQSQALRSARCSRRAQSWITSHPRIAIQLLPDGICLRHGGHSHGCHR